MTSHIRWCYVTVPTLEEGHRIARIVIEERLAACANLLPHMTSLYWWNNIIEETSEAVLILKTSESCTEALIKRIKVLHTYECPCILSFEVNSGFEGFLNYIRAETKRI